MGAKMKNDEYMSIISRKTKDMKLLRDEVKNVTVGIIGQSLLKEDFFFCATADRCMQLIDGFSVMLSARNMTCVGALLRLQLDNCMRTYAAFVAENKEDVVDCLIYGKRIDKLKSRNGDLLKDCYLKAELEKYDPQFAVVYDNASGYIHLSDRAFYQTVNCCQDNTIEWGVGLPLFEKFNPLLIEATDAFIHFTKLHLRMLSAVAESKEKFDNRYCD